MKTQNVIVLPNEDTHHTEVIEPFLIYEDPIFKKDRSKVWREAIGKNWSEADPKVRTTHSKKSGQPIVLDK